MPLQPIGWLSLQKFYADIPTLGISRAPAAGNQLLSSGNYTHMRLVMAVLKTEKLKLYAFSSHYTQGNCIFYKSDESLKSLKASRFSFFG